MKPIDDILKEPEAAKLLRLSPRGIIDWRNQGKIPFIRIGRSIHYRRSSLEAMLARLEEAPVISFGAVMPAGRD